jgi:type IV pilus assembly protein PilC
VPKYSYKIRDDQDRVFGGMTEGTNVDEVLDRLANQNLVPISVNELNFDGSPKGETFFEKVSSGFQRVQKRVPYKSVVFFTRQLATMVNAGVPLAQALVRLAGPERPVLKKIILTVADDIGMGSTFSDAIARHPGAFNNMYVAVVHSGEVAGALDKVLDELATYMENVEAMRQKVKGAMRYPMAISFFITGVVLFLLGWVVPKFKELYDSFGVELPLPTQILIKVSDFVQHNILLVIAAIILLVAGFLAAMTNDSFKRFVHRYFLLFPVFGMITKKNIWAKFCRTMALLMDAGTPILQAIEISGAVVGNKLYSESLEQVYDRLRTGELLSQALNNTGHFPPLIIQLVETGEQSGKVDDLLRKAADFYEREIRVIVDSLAAIIEPFLIVIVGGAVGAILISLYYPIFMVGKLIK